MKYLFYAIVFDVAGNTTAVGSSTSPAKTITTNIQKVTGISINPNSAQTKNIGDTFKITATVSPSDANNKGINWSSSNSSIATVNSSGNVQCVSAGTTIITATASDGSGVKAKLSLTVRDPLTSLTLDKTQTTLLYGGATTTVTATTTPSDYDANNLAWTIGDTSLATISGSGKTRTITSNNTKKTGETTLTISGGGKTATMKISIVNFQTTTYNYTGSVQQVDLPAGTYKLEVWGAQGGSSKAANNIITVPGGKGGYSVGIITLINNTTLYVCVGGQATTPTSNLSYCGFNGGGNGGLASESYNDAGSKPGAGGGGATDISLYGNNKTSDWNTSNHLYSRIIVAGGGGGVYASGYNNEWSRRSRATEGGYGGGTNGQTVDGTTIFYYKADLLATSSQWYRDTGNASYVAGRAGGGLQNTGGRVTAFGYTIQGTPTDGGFGYGGNGARYNSGGGGGGGGWYGGAGGSGGENAWGNGGGGGSGYIYTSSTASNYPSGCLLNSSYYLTNAQTIAGNQSFPNVAGTGNETGHSGNGVAKITPVN